MMREVVLASLDIVGPVIVFGCSVFIALELGVWLGVVKKKRPGQHDWDDDDD